VGAPGKTLKQRKSVIEEYEPVWYCEMVTHPEKYNGMKIAVHASGRFGFEWREMFCMKCRDQGLTWLSFEEDEDKIWLYDRLFWKRPKFMSTINATFYGIFHYPGRKCGDQGGYDFEFLVQFIRSVEVISSDGGDPATLSKNEQEKLCQGNEIYIA
jgi:hypothetical protein